MTRHGDIYDCVENVVAKLLVLKNSCASVLRINKSDSSLIWLQGVEAMLQEAVDDLLTGLRMKYPEDPTEDVEKKAPELLSAGDFDRDHPWNPFRLSESAAPVELKGNLSSWGLSNILQVLSLEQKSGVLQFYRGQTRRALCLKDGNTIAATGNETLRLGQIISSKGLISQKRLQEALENARKTGTRLGEVLLGLRSIDRDTLQDAIRYQIRETMWDLSRWKEGNFEYRSCQVEFNIRGVTNREATGMIPPAKRSTLGEKKRQYPRAEVSWPVNMLTSQGPIEAETRNISLTGALIRCLELPNPNEDLRLAIQIPEYRHTMFATAKLVRLDIDYSNRDLHAYVLGVRFEEIFDRDLKFLSNKIFH